jgi:hypothetical protein
MVSTEVATPLVPTVTVAGLNEQVGAAVTMGVTERQESVTWCPLYVPSGDTETVAVAVSPGATDPGVAVPFGNTDSA